MTGCLRIMVWVIALGTVSAAQAETVYIAERIRLGLRAEMVETSAIVKNIETGTPLEVIERIDKQARVRDPQGAEGWIEVRYLSSDPPSRVQLAKLQEELASSRAQPNEAQAQLKKAQATIAEQAGKIKELERQLAEKPAPAAAPAAGKTPSVRQEAADGGFRFSYLWLVISFAMLGIGFAAGIRWLRESIRKRSGGMYLRV